MILDIMIIIILIFTCVLGYKKGLFYILTGWGLTLASIILSFILINPFAKVILKIPYFVNKRLGLEAEVSERLPEIIANNQGAGSWKATILHKILGDDLMASNASEIISLLLFKIILFFLLFIILRILFIIIRGVISKKIHRIPLIGTANRIVGMGLSLGIGIIILSLLVSMLYMALPFSETAVWIESNSYFAKAIFQNEILLNIMDIIFHFISS